MRSVDDLTLDLQEIQGNRPLIVADCVLKVGEQALQRGTSLSVVIDACMEEWDRRYIAVYYNGSLRSGIEQAGLAIPHLLRHAQESGS